MSETPYDLAAGVFRTQLIDLALKRLKGAAADLETFGLEIANSAALLAVGDLSEEDRYAGRAELLAQLRALAEAHRIETEQAAWDLFAEGVEKALELGVTVAIAAARGALLRHGGAL